ncbi:MAG: hypothetical protein WCV50_05205 [Patescibacteria group bacterium]
MSTSANLDRVEVLVLHTTDGVHVTAIRASYQMRSDSDFVCCELYAQTFLTSKKGSKEELTGYVEQSLTGKTPYKKGAFAETQCLATYKGKLCIPGSNHLLLYCANLLDHAELASSKYDLIRSGLSTLVTEWIGKLRDRGFLFQFSE